VMIIIEIGAGFGIEIIAGAKGQPSVSVLRIMGLGVTATFLVSSWGFVLLSLRLYRQLVLANLAALALAILLSAILIPTLHARGGAITTAILELTLAGSYTTLLYRRGVVPPLRFILRFALAIGLGLGVGAILLTVHPVLGVFTGSVVYFGVLWLTHAIPPELIDALPWQR
jgi:O-antigen/teichoic acid export membrane protein